MFELRPEDWSLWIWWLHALAVYYVANFVWFWFRFKSAEKRARAEGGKALAEYNLLLRGFPNSMFAKMMGKRPFVLQDRPAPDT